MGRNTVRVGVAFTSLVVATSDAMSVETGGRKSIQALVTGTGAVSAAATFQVSNNGVDWLDLATFSLSGTTRDSDGFAYDAVWAYHRVDLTSIAGTGARFTLYMAGEVG